MRDLEIIENYLNGKLSGEELESVKLRMENDPPFAALVEDVRKTYKVLERQWLRKNVDLAAKQLLWQKAAIVAVAAVAIAAVLFLGMFKWKKNTAIQIEPKPLITSVVQNKPAPEPLPLPLPMPPIPGVTAVVESHRTKSECYVAPDIAPAVAIAPAPPQPDTYAAVDIAGMFENTDTQQFTVNPAKAVHIECKGGTMIDIPANSLVMADGSVPKGPVTITVTEYLSYFDLWKHRVSTISNGSMLETGGSCYIKAESAGKPVDVKKGITYDIAFPTKADKRMSTFTGVRNLEGEVVWKQDSVATAVQRQRKKLIVKGVISESVPYGDYNCNCQKTEYYFDPVISDEGFYDADKDVYTFNRLQNREKIEQWFDTFANFTSSDIKKLVDRNSKLRLRFALDPNGNLKEYDYNFKASKQLEKRVKGIAAYIIANAKIEHTFSSGKNMFINLDLMPKSRIVAENLKAIDTTASKAEQLAVKRQNLNIISATGFGFINCDFFSSRNVKANARIVVGTPSAAAQVKVFFTNFKVTTQCHQQGDQAIFGPVPSNEPILIVATMIKNSELMMCLKKSNTSDSEDLKTEDFVPYNQNALMAFLNTAEH